MEQLQICKNGKNCKFLKNNQCKFQHPDNCELPEPSQQVQSKPCTKGINCKFLPQNKCNYYHSQEEIQKATKPKKNSNKVSNQNFKIKGNNQKGGQDDDRPKLFTVKEFEVQGIKNFSITINNFCPLDDKCKVDQELGMCKYTHRDQLETTQNDPKEQIDIRLIVQKFLTEKKKNNYDKIQQQEFLDEKQIITITDNWEFIDHGLLQHIIQKFQIQEHFLEQNLLQKTKKLLLKQDMKTAEACSYLTYLIKTPENQRDYIEFLMQEMKDFPKAQRMCNSYKIDHQKEYPQIMDNLGSEFINYKIRDACKKTKESKNNDELIFLMSHLETQVISQQRHLKLFINLLAKKSQLIDFAYSVYKRWESTYPQLQQQVFQDVLDYQFYKNSKYMLIPNRIFDSEKNKQFGPTEEMSGYEKNGTYFNLTNHGNIQEKDILWVDNLQNQEQLDKFNEITQNKFLLNTKIAGFDSESNTGFYSGFSLLQFSTNEATFIIDYYTMIQKKDKISIQIVGNFIKQLFENPDIEKVGAGISGDMDDLRKHFYIEKLQEKSLVDLQPAFSQLYPKITKRNLLVISQEVLGIPISKIEQCSAWNVRPLRRGQLHYAALDAYICQKIWQKIKQDFPDYKQ